METEKDLISGSLRAPQALVSQTCGKLQHGVNSRILSDRALGWVSAGHDHTRRTRLSLLIALYALVWSALLLPVLGLLVVADLFVTSWILYLFRLLFSA